MTPPHLSHKVRVRVKFGRLCRNTQFTFPLTLALILFLVIALALNLPAQLLTLGNRHAPEPLRTISRSGPLKFVRYSAISRLWSCPARCASALGALVVGKRVRMS